MQTSIRVFAMIFLLFIVSGDIVAASSLKTRNVVLITLDGVRVQDFFGGLDSVIDEHDSKQIYSDMVAMRERFGAETPEARRALLMPNVWNVLAPQGMVFGSLAHDNHVKVQNRIQWSTPGYTEILTGAPRADVVDNDNLRHDYKTVLEYAREALGLEFHQVAQFGGWDGFKFAAASQDDAFLMNGTYDAVPAPWNTPEMDLLNELRKEVMGLWEEGSNDALTYRMAKGYIQKNKPRVMWLAMVNSDDWAHADRYDRFLAYMNRTDAQVGDLWNTLQAIDEYRDSTTMIITTDHGRGVQDSDWSEHDITIPGSDDIWMVVAGPDTPDVGEVTSPGTVFQGQAAATMLQYLGLDYRNWDKNALPPVAGTLVAPAATSE